MKRGPRAISERERAPGIRLSGRLYSPEGLENRRRRDAARYRALRAVARMHSAEYAAEYAVRSADRSSDYRLRKQAAQRAVARNHPEDYAQAFAAAKTAGGVAS